jgi:hypothetical protein
MKAVLIVLALFGLMTLGEWVASIMPQWVSVTLFIALMVVSMRAIWVAITKWATK